MDLIYADKNRIELGVIQDCEFDCAFGVSENDFVCTVDMDNHVCQEDYFIYFDGTQYGGIVDKIGVSTENHTITYKGRTWHGILNTRVLYPANGYDYLVFVGEANEVISQIISMIGLNDIFIVSTEDSGLYIPGYQVRYEYAYTSILAMLQTVNGKLIFEHEGTYCKLSAVNVADYSSNEEFDSSQVEFNAEKTFNTYNHFICLGSGNLKDRHVIHLFTNENGEIQTYKNVENPLSDADYILDESRKAISGLEERVYKYDLSGAQTTENYVKMDHEPLDWTTNYTDYFQYNRENEEYEQIKEEKQDQYMLTKCKPYDWVTDYDNYYYECGYNYDSVDPVLNENGDKVAPDWQAATYYTLTAGIYVLQTSQPSDWELNYKNYYYMESVKYKCISALLSEKAYTLITQKPSTWEFDFKNFFEKVNGEYKAVSMVEKAVYNRVKKQPNDWKKNYGQYFYFYSDGVNSEYRGIEGKQKIYYTVQKRKPTDWNDSYDSYYELNAKGKYIKVEIKNYKRLTKKPADWAKKFSKYFYYYSDGTKGEYKAVSGISTNKYTLQSNRPTDWYSNYEKYFYKSDSGYKKVEGVALAGAEEKVAPVWKASTYYTMSNTTTAPDYNSYSRVYKKADPPKWKKARYYTQENKKVTPKFNSYAKVYKEVVTTSIPQWAANKYYSEHKVNDLEWEANKYYLIHENQEIIPDFISGKYYKRYLDHYADLVENAVKKIEEIYNCDSIDMNLSLEDNYDIGDIVGATECITGISVWQPITKKIVKIKGNEVSIEYEVGGK